MQWEYPSALPEDENGLTNPFRGVSWEEYSERVLPRLMSCEDPVDMPDRFAPETYCSLWDGGRMAGEFRIRHRLTEALRCGAGQAGYSIAKQWRGRGYGTAGLCLVLPLARDIVERERLAGGIPPVKIQDRHEPEFQAGRYGRIALRIV